MTDLDLVKQRGAALGFTVNIAGDEEWCSLSHPETPELFAGPVSECAAFLTGWLLARGGRTTK